MLDTIGRYNAGWSNPKDAVILGKTLGPVADRLSTQAVKTAGLVIKAGGGVLAKIGAADFYAIVQGSHVTIAASTDMPALTGNTIAANSFNAFCFFVDIAGVVTVAAGTAGTALGLVKMPQFPLGKALVGYLLVTHSATFTGNTTALDTATTVYFSPTGPIDPTILL